VPCETPGTQAFADAVVHHVEQHNTVLLANHGVVTWADSLTHAEWYVEVMDTACRVMILAAQLGVPPAQMPETVVHDLLALKRRLRLPDARFGDDQPPTEHALELDRRVHAITDQVLEALGK